MKKRVLKLLMCSSFARIGCVLAGARVRMSSKERPSIEVNARVAFSHFSKCMYVCDYMYVLACEWVVGYANKELL